MKWNLESSNELYLRYKENHFISVFIILQRNSAEILRYNTVQGIDFKSQFDYYYVIFAIIVYFKNSCEIYFETFWILFLVVSREKSYMLLISESYNFFLRTWKENWLREELNLKFDNYKIFFYYIFAL